MSSMPPANRNGTLRLHATACVAAGLCALPAVRRGDEKRAALSSWKPYQSRLPSDEELGSWFVTDTAMCLVCGAVSGNLEMIDFDLGGEAFDAWADAVNASAPELLPRLVIETTPSGGRHVVYRCESPVSGNTKLAQRRIEVDCSEPVVIGCKEYVPRKDASGTWCVIITMIETRGEGGLFLCAPSNEYELLQGDLCHPPVITADERDILLGCAWALDEMPTPVVNGSEPTSSGSPSALRPGDDFNDRGNPREILRNHGWTLVKSGASGGSGGNAHWRRPGKLSGTSATLKDGVFYVFSTNAAPFEAQKGYSPFAVYALLEHHGDFTAAATALAKDGYGQTPEVQGVDLSGFIAAKPPAPSPEQVIHPAPLSVNTRSWSAAMRGGDSARRNCCALAMCSSRTMDRLWLSSQSTGSSALTLRGAA